jgi:hypothetical protein
MPNPSLEWTATGPSAQTLWRRQSVVKLSYAFSLTPPVSPPKPAEKLAEYSYNEFWIDLPTHWRQVPTPEDRTVTFFSEVDDASITISVDFFEVPDEKAHRVAEKCLESRREALDQMSPGNVNVLNRSIKPHSGGVGLEMNIGAEISGGHVYLYIGYVTTRKIFNFTLVCKSDKFAAAELFNKMMGNIRVQLP